ncbi:transposase [Streptomyces sp. RB6PN23]|uniref:Transposase n=1 Tax=Streptomyces silvisoli TaxID=3034235 RepID=A0ABT5ZP07_9ACTN|nr:transposase [Streptomyces silvisoli]MDF3291556.1 transposase [Streptomyces silvisoli]
MTGAGSPAAGAAARAGSHRAARRKDGTATAHVGRQWLGRWGKTDNCVVTVTTVWTDGRVYYPLHAVPYTPAHRFPRGRNDPAFRTKPQLSAALAAEGKAAGFPCWAVVADCAYSVSDDWYYTLDDADLPYVVALKPHRGTWAPANQPHTPVDAARALAWRDAGHPGDWTPVARRFRYGHTETWWAADATLGSWQPHGLCRLVVATTDRATLPDKATWYLSTNLPHPDTARGHIPALAHRPRRDRPPLWAAAVDRAELQADQGRTRLGRLPGPLQPRHPPPPDPGELRVHLLLGPVVRPTRTAGCHRAGAPVPAPGLRGGPTIPRQPQPPCWARALRTVRSRLTLPSPCNAGGRPGQTRTRLPGSRPCSTQSPPDTAMISTTGSNELPVAPSAGTTSRRQPIPVVRTHHGHQHSRPRSPDVESFAQRLCRDGPSIRLPTPSIFSVGVLKEVMCRVGLHKVFLNGEPPSPCPLSHLR